MPFTRNGSEIDRIEMTQRLGWNGRYFQLNEGFEFQDQSMDGPVIALAQNLDEEPLHGNGTDLASVPTLFWSLIAPFGRQSPAAIIHDQSCAVAALLPPAQEIAARKEIDRVFWLGLRDQRVPRFRARLMWAFVSVQRYFHPAPLVAIAIFSLIGMTLAVVIGVVVEIAWGKALALALLALPTVCVLGGWRIKGLLAFLTVSSLVLFPIVILQFFAVVTFRLVELVCSIGDSQGGPIVTPTIAKRPAQNDGSTQDGSTQ